MSDLLDLSWWWGFLRGVRFGFWLWCRVVLICTAVWVVLLCARFWVLGLGFGVFIAIDIVLLRIWMGGLWVGVVFLVVGGLFLCLAC